MEQWDKGDGSPCPTSKQWGQVLLFEQTKAPVPNV